MKALVLLSHTYWYELSDHDRLRAWVAFRQASGFRFERAEERRFLTELYQQVHRQIYYIWNDRANRNTKANRDFYEHSVRRYHAWASRMLPADWLNEFLFDPAVSLQRPTTNILKVSRHGMVASMPAGQQSVVIKQFKPRHAADRWLSRYRGSPASHCYRMAYRLETAQIPTARPLAIVEKRRHGLLEISYFIMEYLQDTIPLSDYWSLASRHQWKACLNELAEILQRLHLFRMSHRDLKVVNILVRPCKDGPPEIFLIDLRGVSHSHWLSNNRKKKDLARLALSALVSLQVSRTYLLRFLKRYLMPNQLQHWKFHWRSIARLMQNKMVRNHKRQRLLS
jgi:serine/threonine protein kinase